MKHNYNAIDWIVIVLVIAGGINWGLVGFFDFNVIGTIFSKYPIIADIIYALVGISALYMIYIVSRSPK